MKSLSKEISSLGVESLRKHYVWLKRKNEKEFYNKDVVEMYSMDELNHFHNEEVNIKSLKQLEEIVTKSGYDWNAIFEKLQHFLT